MVLATECALMKVIAVMEFKNVQASLSGFASYRADGIFTDMLIDDMLGGVHQRRVVCV